jgi:hypothetical protein
MKSSVRDAVQIALFLAIALLSNLRFLYQEMDIKVWLTGAVTGVLLTCAIMLAGQIINQRKRQIT